MNRPPSWTLGLCSTFGTFTAAPIVKKGKKHLENLKLNLKLNLKFVRVVTHKGDKC